MMNSKDFAHKIEEWIDNKKGTDIQIIDISQSSIGDYFVIASGNTERQVSAIADYIQYEASQLGRPVKSVEGQHESRWILLDYYDVVVHIFQKDARQFYHLERLWQQTGERSHE